MKAVIGILLIVGGLALGVYVGLWVFLVGGIVQIVQAIRADELPVNDLAWGIGKVLFAGFAGWLSAVVLMFPGYLMLAGEAPKRRRFR